MRWIYFIKLKLNLNFTEFHWHNSDLPWMMGFVQGVVIASGMVLGCENFISLTYVEEGMQVDWNRRKRVQISKQQDWCRACERAVIVATSGFLCCVWRVCCRRLSLAFFRGFVVPSRGKEDLRCCFFPFCRPAKLVDAAATIQRVWLSQDWTDHATNFNEQGKCRHLPQALCHSPLHGGWNILSRHLSAAARLYMAWRGRTPHS